MFQEGSYKRVTNFQIYRRANKKIQKNPFKYKEVKGGDSKTIQFKVIILSGPGMGESLDIGFPRNEDYYNKKIYTRRINKLGDMVETSVFSKKKIINIKGEILRLPYQWETDRHESIHFPGEENAKIYNTINKIVIEYNKCKYKNEN